mmetsp:Transcript_26107/g.42447  ORF Transcript_26107/g.42447 Transcript_26107/m.42447 type:complete len:220 (-) Transcript_26107:131-790(-)
MLGMLHWCCKCQITFGDFRSRPFRATCQFSNYLLHCNNSPVLLLLCPSNLSYKSLSDTPGRLLSRSMSPRSYLLRPKWQMFCRWKQELKSNSRTHSPNRLLLPMQQNQDVNTNPSLKLRQFLDSCSSKKGAKDHDHKRVCPTQCILEIKTIQVLDHICIPLLVICCSMDHCNCLLNMHQAYNKLCHSNLLRFFDIETILAMLGDDQRMLKVHAAGSSHC